MPQKLQAMQKGDLTAQAQQLQPVLSQVLQQLNDMLATLDKPLSTADKLALIENLYDDVAELLESHF